MFSTVWLCCGKRAGQGSQGLGMGIAEHSKMPGPVPSPVIGLIPPGHGHFLRSTLVNLSPASGPLTWPDNSIHVSKGYTSTFFFSFLVFIKLPSSLSCSSGPLYTHRRAPGTPLRPYVAGTCLETGKLEITLAMSSASVIG